MGLCGNEFACLMRELVLEQCRHGQPIRDADTRAKVCCKTPHREDRSWQRLQCLQLFEPSAALPAQVTTAALDAAQPPAPGTPPSTPTQKTSAFMKKLTTALSSTRACLACHSSCRARGGQPQGSKLCSKPGDVVLSCDCKMPEAAATEPAVTDEPAQAAASAVANGNVANAPAVTAAPAIDAAPASNAVPAVSTAPAVAVVSTAPAVTTTPAANSQPPLIAQPAAPSVPAAAASG